MNRFAIQPALAAPVDRLAPADAAAPLEARAELEMVLAAWHAATERLRHTHEALRAEVKRLSDELEAKNRQLQRKDRLADLGQMASHVAHEVRNGLAPVKLYLSLLRRRCEGDSDNRDIFGKIEANLMALETTVNDLLHFTAHRDPNRHPFAVRELIDDVCSSLAPQLAAQRIEVAIDVSPTCRHRGDRDMLRRAVLNLLLNALDAMPQGGRLDVIACQLGDRLEIEVADSGPGIQQAARSRLFEPFFTTKSGGTGLGLAIVERIAEAHGGTVRAANCPQGGAAFTLSLPAGTAEVALRAA